MSLEGKSKEEIEALAALAADVLSKPDTAGVFQRLVKKNNPDVSMPMVELEDKARAEFARLEKKNATLEARLDQSDSQNGVNVLYENLRETGVVSTRAGFNQLVAWASENGFMTTEMGLRKAAMQREIEQESAEPTPPSLGNGSFPVGGTDEDSKNFFRNPISHARTVAAQAMDELRVQRSKGNKVH